MLQDPDLAAIDPAEFSRCLFEESSDSLFVFDPDDLSIIAANPAAQRLTGLSRRELLSLGVAELFAAEHPELLSELFASCQETRLFHSREAYRLAIGDRDAVEVNLTVSRLHTKPKVLGVVAVRDVTKRRRIEAELRRTESLLQANFEKQSEHLAVATRDLRRSEEKYRTIVDATSEWIWQCDVNGVFTYSNPAVKAILDYEPEEMVGRSGLDFLCEEDRTKLAADVSEMMAEAKGWNGWVIRWQRRDGTLRLLESNATPIFDEEGHFVGYRGADRDITERIHAVETLRARERELAHVSRLSIMGEMVAAIAHEVNQPLSAIANYADAAQCVMAERGVSPEDDVSRWIAHMGEQAIRCGDIIRRLRNFVRKDESERTLVGLDEVIGDSKKLLEWTIAEQHIDFDVEVPKPIPYVIGNATELQQVFVNLIRNACDALAESGVEHPVVLIKASIQQDDVHVTVEDNGSGIDAESAAHMFDPFFSTKQSGMGMGLAISRSIIQHHQGRLWRDVDRGVGSCFHIKLPKAPSDAEQDNRVE